MEWHTMSFQTFMLFQMMNQNGVGDPERKHEADIRRFVYVLKVIRCIVVTLVTHVSGTLASTDRFDRFAC